MDKGIDKGRSEKNNNNGGEESELAEWRGITELKTTDSDKSNDLDKPN